MSSDEQYLADAGIDAETGNAVAEKSTESATVSTHAASEGTTAPAAASKTVEMFELDGKKYPTTTEFQLTHGGKVLKVPYSNMANTYRQWQHLQDKWNTEYKPKISEWEKTKPEFDKYKGFYEKYGALQEWSEKNPDQWTSLFDYWQNRNQHLLAAKVGGAQSAHGDTGNQHSPLNPLVEKISQLEKQIEEDRSKYGKYIEKFETTEKTKQETEDVEFVKTEIKDFQKDHPEINLDERNPDGVSLWAQIVQWGLSRGYPDFESAARVYLKQRLADTYASRAREEVRGVVKQDRINGVIKRSATPFNKGQEPSVRQAGNVRSKSYGDLAEEAKAELAALSGT